MHQQQDRKTKIFYKTVAVIKEEGNYFRLSRDSCAYARTPNLFSYSSFSQTRNYAVPLLLLNWLTLLVALVLPPLLTIKIFFSSYCFLFSYFFTLLCTQKYCQHHKFITALFKHRLRDSAFNQRRVGDLLMFRDRADENKTSKRLCWVDSSSTRTFWQQVGISTFLLADSQNADVSHRWEETSNLATKALRNDWIYYYQTNSADCLPSHHHLISWLTEIP